MWFCNSSTCSRHKKLGDTGGYIPACLSQVECKMSLLAKARSRLSWVSGFVRIYFTQSKWNGPVALANTADWKSVHFFMQRPSLKYIGMLASDFHWCGYGLFCLNYREGKVIHEASVQMLNCHPRIGKCLKIIFCFFCHFSVRQAMIKIDNSDVHATTFNITAMMLQAKIELSVFSNDVRFQHIIG